MVSPESYSLKFFNFDFSFLPVLKFPSCDYLNLVFNALTIFSSNFWAFSSFIFYDWISGSYKLNE
jgi:hypothetical protein